MIRPAHYEVTKIDDCCYEISFVVNPDLPYFEGHFKSQAILPGVVQLGYVMEFSGELFSIKLKSDFPQLKFTAPILPLDRLKLTLNYDTKKARIAFKYLIENENKVASEGKVIVNV